MLISTRYLAIYVVFSLPILLAFLATSCSSKNDLTLLNESTQPVLESGKLDLVGIGSPSAPASMQMPRIFHTSTLVNTNGSSNVVVIGGKGDFGAVEAVEIYHTKYGKWTFGAEMPSATYAHSANLILEDVILISGGVNASGTSNSSHIYDLETDSWSVTGLSLIHI